MILEAIVTTIDADGLLNVAPMGPRVEPGSPRFVLSPFRSSTTYRNLDRQGEGVLHVTDDVLLLARSAIGQVPDAPTRPAERVRGRVLTGSCRYEEFRVVETDLTEERARFVCEAVHLGRFRDFFGFNRAKHAVVETAILATRANFLPLDQVAADLARHRLVIGKTGGQQETEAFSLLTTFIEAAAARRGFVMDGSP